MSVDALRARAAQLSFKAATGGLTPEEQAELEQIRQQIAMQSGTRK